MRTKEALLGIVDDARGGSKGWTDGFTDAEVRDAKGLAREPGRGGTWATCLHAGRRDPLFGDGTGETPEGPPRDLRRRRARADDKGTKVPAARRPLGPTSTARTRG